MWSFEFDDCKAAAEEKDKPADIIPSEYRVKRVAWFLVAGFTLGLVPLFVVPLLLGFCPTTPQCEHNPSVVGTRVAVVHPGADLAFQDFVSSHKLIEDGRAAKGNLGYEVIKDFQTPNAFRFIEHWDSKVNLEAWMTHVDPLFHQPAMKNLLVGEHLQQFGLYSYYQPSGCRDVTWGFVDINVNAGCDKVWSVVSNWSDCTWVVGCDYAVVNKNEPMVRDLHMKDGTKVVVELRKLDAGGRELIYEVLRPFPYIGHLKLSSMAATRGCSIGYQFTLPKISNLTADAVYTDFLNVRKPAIQELFRS